MALVHTRRRLHGDARQCGNRKTADDRGNVVVTASVTGGDRLVRYAIALENDANVSVNTDLERRQEIAMRREREIVSASRR